MAQVEVEPYPLWEAEIRDSIDNCKTKLSLAMAEGVTPEDIIKAVADEIGLDMRGIPPFFVQQIAQSMVTIVPSNATG